MSQHIDIIKQQLRFKFGHCSFSVSGKDRNYLNVIIDVEFTPEQITDKVTQLLNTLNIPFKEITTKTNSRGCAHWFTIRKIG